MSQEPQGATRFEELAHESDLFSRPSSAASNHELTSSKYPDQDLGRSKQQQEILHGGEAPQDYSQLSTGVGKMQQRKTVIRKSLNDAAD
jgi:hypothetical protein